jgi:UDP-glucose 4-epimerase
MKDRVLITGGAGFIGSHLVDHLIAHGHQVTVLDDFSSGEMANLDSAQATGKLSLVKGSILDPAALDRAMEGCNRVFHLAVQCVRRSLGQPLANHEVNATGTLLTLDAARRARVMRFVYCSSSEVYGNSGNERLVEDTSHCAPVTVYGAAKLAGEYYAKAYHQTYGLPAVIVRPFNAYGPREHERGDLAEVIPRFIIRLLNGLPPIVFGNGSNGRDFTYVAEVARGLASAGNCDAAVGRTINIAYGRVVTLRELAEMLMRLCGRPDLKPIFIEPRPGDVMTLHADTQRARDLLGYRASIDIESGLARYLDWFRAHHNDPADLLEADPRNWQMPTDYPQETRDAEGRQETRA